MATDSGKPSNRYSQFSQFYKLEQPEKLQDVLDDDKSNCTICRLTGAAAFAGLGAYSYFSGQYHLERQRAAISKSKSIFGMKSRKAGVTSIAAAFVGMGLWRLIN